jgi:hypothetical protein
VIAVDGFLPVVPGWDPPLAPLDGLPILLLGDPPAPTAPSGLLRGDVLSGDRLDETLTSWGASVTRVAPGDGADGEIPAEAMATWLAAQRRRTRAQVAV